MDSVGKEPSLRRMPVVINSEQLVSIEDQAVIHKLAQTRMIRTAYSADTLVDQVLAAVHYPLAKLVSDKREMLRNLYRSDTDLFGKKVLIVDDDIRNIFALSSVLEWRSMVILSAETGRDAIDLLQKNPDVDVVLMDIMMPEMDGYETIRAIRQIPRFSSLPIIAVTAKAMKGDREKCIEAGAWDYLAKPVDSEQMLAVLRAWLHRQRIGDPAPAQALKLGGSGRTMKPLNTSTSVPDMSGHRKVNVLIVDDHPHKILALEAVLATLGENVVTALSGRDALRRLMEQDFAVILLDVNMPDMDGFEAATLIRQHPRCAHTPIIFVTAFGDSMHTEKGYSLGAVDYILSPVVPDVLRTKVSVFADLFRKSEEIKRHAEERIAWIKEQAARAALKKQRAVPAFWRKQRR